MGYLAEQPIELGGLKCRNRIIRSATHSFLGDRAGHMTPEEYAMYEKLADHAVGTIITGHVCVMPGGKANPEQIVIWDEGDIPQFRKAAELVRSKGSRFIVQISHAGPRTIEDVELADVVARPLKKDREARTLRTEEIHEITEAFIRAAVRLQKAGVDGVQLHAAHSYLLSRFLDPTFNQREDEYGGDVQGRFRIVEEILQGIRRECGKEFPVLIKLNVDTKSDGKAYEEDMIYILNRCRELGVTLAELSGVDFINQPKTARLYYLDQAAELRRKADLPMSLVGGVRSMADMEKVLSSGLDMVSLARPLIAEPDFVTKSLEGQEKSICVSCCRCFVLPNKHPGERCIWERKKKRKESGNQT